MKKYFILGALSFFFMAAPAFAANPFADITFPIAELGNCGSLHACFVYCNDPANQDACAAYASAHGLAQQPPPGQQNPAAQNGPSAPSGLNGPNASQINGILAQGGGPGGCTSADACKTYCEDIHHITECLAFGKAHNLLSAEQIAQGEKMAAALASGITTPGNCTSQASCQQYCSDPSHREECMTFAEKTGLGPPPSSAMNGQGPNGSEPMTGPGGCDSPESCASYCNEPANQATCIKFAEAHGFMQGGPNGPGQNGPNGREGGDQGDLQALAHIAQGLSNAPDSVKQCLTSALGADGFSALEAGTAPSLDKIPAIKTCFQEGQQAMQKSFADQLSSNPVAKECIVKAIGQDALDQMEQKGGAPDPALAAKVGDCFNQSHRVEGPPPNGNFATPGGPQGPQYGPPPQNGQGPNQGGQFFGPPPSGGQPGGPNSPYGPNMHMDNGPAPENGAPQNGPQGDMQGGPQNFEGQYPPQGGQQNFQNPPPPPGGQGGQSAYPPPQPGSDYYQGVFPNSPTGAPQPYGIPPPPGGGMPTSLPPPPASSTDSGTPPPPQPTSFAAPYIQDLPANILTGVRHFLNALGL